jgi:hypothetical protein
MCRIILAHTKTFLYDLFPVHFVKLYLELTIKHYVQE